MMIIDVFISFSTVQIYDLSYIHSQKASMSYKKVYKQCHVSVTVTPRKSVCQLCQGACLETYRHPTLVFTLPLPTRVACDHTLPPTLLRSRRCVWSCNLSSKTFVQYCGRILILQLPIHDHTRIASIQW